MALDETAPYAGRARSLAETDWPVLGSSEAVFADTDALVNRSLREVGLYAERDPGLALRLILRANAPRPGLKQEVHSVPDAIAMLGLRAVHEEIERAPRVEDILPDPQPYRRRAAQARLAALIVEELGRVRHDSEPGELGLAALLNDLGMLALEMTDAPELPGLRSMLQLRALPDEASYVALGYATDDLSRGMAEHMHLPELVRGTLRAENAAHPRAMEVMVASAVAGQIFHGMDTLREDRDLRLLAELLGEPDKAAADRLGRLMEGFNRDAWLYAMDALDPAAIARVWREDCSPVPLGLAPRGDIAVSGELALQREPHRGVRLRRLLRACQFGLGLNRVVFAELAHDGDWLQAADLVGTLHEPEFSHFGIGRHDLGAMGAVLEQTDPVWWSRDYPDTPLPGAVAGLTGGVDCLLAPVREHGRCIGMIYADRRSPALALDPRTFDGFARLLAAARR
ncbi:MULTISPECIES: HDOD domain-containing protein [unclassified Thioalkalivibrio]|uniref:HDOD domain-containing protein n=1 Tax=unclassified Thioalkalivibrio TaxID=2621013 RepID=UPI00035D2652|nr:MULTISPECIES: HDOD domain-containing protein [unclassified Thioalkalivibrio]